MNPYNQPYNQPGAAYPAQPQPTPAYPVYTQPGAAYPAQPAPVYTQPVIQAAPMPQPQQIEITADINRMLGLGKCLRGLAIFELVCYCLSIVGLVFIAFPINAMNGIPHFDLDKMKCYRVWRYIVLVLSCVSFVSSFSYGNSTPIVTLVITIAFQVCLFISV